MLKMIKEKNGQIFLILTLLVMIYLVLISSVGLEIERNQYVGSENNEQLFFNHVDEINTQLQDSLYIFLSRVTQEIETIDSAEDQYSTFLQNLTSYSLRSGFILTFEEHSLSLFYDNSLDGVIAANASASLTVLFTLSQNNWAATTNQIFSISYAVLELSAGDTTIQLLHTVNGIKEGVSEATISVNTEEAIPQLADSFNTVSPLSTGDEITVRIDNGISLVVNV